MPNPNWKKNRCYAEHVRKWQEMEIFQQQHCRFAIYLMDLTQTVLHNADEYNDETSKKTGLKCWKPIQYYQVVASKKSCRLPALRQLRRGQQKVVVHLWLRRNIGRVIRSHRYMVETIDKHCIWGMVIRHVTGISRVYGIWCKYKSLSNFWTAACSVNYTLLFQTLVAGTEEPWRCKWHQNILYTTGRNKSCEMKFRINHQHLALPGLILFMKHHETLIHGQSFMCSLLRKAVKLFTWAECNGLFRD